jgi:hypothetical protein
MRSFIKVDEKKYFFEFIIKDGYFKYGVIENYKFEVDKNNLQDLVFTFQDHIQHWMNLEQNQDNFKHQSIIEFLTIESDHSFELEENSWIEMGLEGEIISISTSEIIIKLSKGELFIDLTADNFIKDIVLEQFQENEIELVIGEKLELNECDVFLFLTEEQRQFWVKKYVEKIEKLNNKYQHNQLETIKIN